MSARKADHLADDLLRRVVGGDLRPGALLPKEGELAARYAVNRSVVREAVKQLEVHGLVRPVQRRGTEVLDPLGSPSPEVLRAMIVPRPGVVDRGALKDLLEIRAQLDAEMSVLAAERRTEGDLERMQQCVLRLERAIGDPDAYARAMTELTLTVAQATQNRIYPMLVHWHARVRADLPILEMVVRFANEPHLQGVRMWMELIRDKDTVRVRSFVAAVHAWAIPRMLEAVALTHAEPSAEPRSSKNDETILGARKN